MMSLLLTDAGASTSWALPIILLALLGGFYFYSLQKQKKYAATAQKLVSELKVGDKVKTYAGFYGTIVQIETVGQVKTAILKTGNDAFQGFISVDINAIYALSPELEVVVTDEVLPDSNDAVAIIEEKAALAEQEPKTAKPKAKSKSKSSK